MRFKSLRNIFSITNSENRKHKILCILGLKIKFKRNQNKKVKFSKTAKPQFFISPNLNLNSKKVAIFASFSLDCTIPEYVLYSLKNLKETADTIIFVADNPLQPNEIEKLKPYADIIKCKRHLMYDFGSYKTGLKLAKKYSLLKNCEYLFVLNDSFYGPINPTYTDLFDNMPQNVDFYGISINEQICEHIQSFFYIFKKQVFNHPSFNKFFNSVKKECYYWDVVTKYEVKLTKHLADQGFKYSSYLPLFIDGIERDKTQYPLTLMRDYACPIVKAKVLTKKSPKEEPQKVLEYIKQNNIELYNIILEDISRRKNYSLK